MPIPKEKIKIINDLLKQMSEGLTRQEFVNSFKSVVNMVVKAEKTLIDKINHSILDSKKLFTNLESELKTNINKEISDLKEPINKALREQEIGMNFIRDKVRKLKHRKDGHTPIKGKDYFDGKDGSPDTPEQVRNKLEGLKGNERIEIEAIRDLQEKLDELKANLEKRVIYGGGFSKMAMDRHILDPYTPTGTVDGSNTDFTLVKAPNPATSLKVLRGGQKQQLTTDYTVSGKTVTFLIAPVSGEIIEVEHRI